MRKFLKLNLIILLSAMLMLFLGVSVIGSNIDEYKEEFDFQKVADSVGGEALAVLNELGIDEISYENLFSVDFMKVLNVLFDMWKKAFSEPVKYFSIAIGVMLLTCALTSFVQSKEMVNIIGSSALALLLAVPIAQAVTNAFSVLEALSTFTTVFAGVFCAVVSSSGNVALGTSYASLAMVSDTLFSVLLSGVSQPAVNAMCSFSFLSCFDIYKFSARVSATVKKIYISFLGFIATFFSGIVTLKGVLGAGADSLTAKGVKFVVGRTVPVVGGAVSDTYSALVSSLSLIRNTVGVFGIITVVLTVLPTLLQLLSWILVLSLASTIAEFLSAESSLGMLGVLKDALVLLSATIVFSAVIFVVSVGVVMFIGGV